VRSRTEAAAEDPFVAQQAGATETARLKTVCKSARSVQRFFSLASLAARWCVAFPSNSFRCVQRPQSYELQDSAEVASRPEGCAVGSRFARRTRDGPFPAGCDKLLEYPPVGPWRSWERASMASRRSWVRIPSAPPFEEGPARTLGLQNVPATQVTALGRPESKKTTP
jgi:hypothetical protein